MATKASSSYDEPVKPEIHQPKNARHSNIGRPINLCGLCFGHAERREIPLPPPGGDLTGLGDERDAQAVMQFGDFQRAWRQRDLRAFAA